MKLSNSIGLAAVLALASAPTLADPVCTPLSVGICKDTTSPVSVFGVNGFRTTGADMDGMTVTAVFTNDAGSLTATSGAIWSKTGDNSGSAGADVESGEAVLFRWNLSVDGDTFDSLWNFDFTGNDDFWRLVSLTLSGVDAGVVFDTKEPDEGTSGSKSGRDFEQVACGNPAPDCSIAAVVYSEAVRVGDAAVQGDVFFSIQANFLGTSQPFNDFSFVQDTDLVVERPNPAPEPGTLMLAGLALAGLGIARRRTR